METQTYQIGGLTLRARRELVGPGGAVALGGRALDLLSALAEAGGALITKDDLFAAVWDGSIVEENALQAQISAARKALGDEARRLVTVHGRGYRLDLDQPEGGAREADQASIAVLPFENVGNAEHAYLADGLADELISRLARVSGLKVPARTSSFAYRGKAADIRTIAAELGVATVLEGSVRADGERLRVSVQLVDAGSGFNLWAESFDRRFGDLFALQDEIAGAIAVTLRAQLGVEQQRTPDFEAYHLYLRARALCETYRPADLYVALGLLDQAIERDPEFASARSQRGYCIHLGIMYGEFAPNRHEQVSADAEFALTLDPHDSRIHALDGLVRASRCDWRGAQEAYTRSLAIGGCDPAEYGNFGYYVLAPLGRFQPSIEQIEVARNAAPADPGIAGMLVLLHWTLRGDVDTTRTSLDHAFKLGFPSDSFLVGSVRAMLALHQGDIEGALAILSATTPPEWRELGAVPVLEQTFRALAFQADRTSAATDLKALLDRARGAGSLDRTKQLSAYVPAWLTALGALDEAYEVAEELVGSLRSSGFLSPVILLAIWNPFMRPFREDPRFQRFVRALGMFEYWEQHGPPDGHAIENDRLICL